jgi:hypothetical protein
MANAAAHMAILQRAPIYLVARQSVDVTTDWIRRFLPARREAGVIRLKNVLLETGSASGVSAVRPVARRCRTVNFSTRSLPHTKDQGPMSQIATKC